MCYNNLIEFLFFFSTIKIRFEYFRFTYFSLIVFVFFSTFDFEKEVKRQKRKKRIFLLKTFNTWINRKLRTEVFFIFFIFCSFFPLIKINVNYKVYKRRILKDFTIYKREWSIEEERFFFIQKHVSLNLLNF